MKGPPRSRDHLALQPQLLGGLLDRNQRIVDIGKCRDHRLTVGLQQFILPGLGELEIAENSSAVENRLRQTADHAEERRVGLEQRRQRRALVAALPGQQDAREELRAGVSDIGSGRSELRFLASDIRTLRQQFRRKTWCHSWQRYLVHRATGHLHAFRRPRYQRRQRIDVQRQGLPQRRNGGPLIGDNGFLLGHIEIGPGAGFEPLLDRLEDACRAGDVLLGGANPVLRGEHLKIGIGDAGEGGKRNHIAIETIRDRRFLCRLCGIAVLAPEIEFIAGAERGRIVDDLASTNAQSTGARS